MNEPLAKHPIRIIKTLEAFAGRGLFFEFSRYHYVPRSIDDTRTLTLVGGADVEGWFRDEQARLGAQQDLAFHSRVYFSRGGEFAHAPMIDFKDMPSRMEMGQVSEVLAAFGVRSYRLFSSGRSLHLYGESLIEAGAWTAFLGRLLLLNLPSQKEIIDSRWVGHRLMAGYGTLRWTKNNPHYKGLPTLVDENSL